MDEQSTMTVTGDKDIADVLHKLSTYDDLLAACKDMLQHIEADIRFSLTGPKFTSAMHRWDTARAAIAKATEPTP